MKLENPMLVVTDIDKSVEFYKKSYWASCYYGLWSKQNFDWWLSFTDR